MCRINVMPFENSKGKLIAPSERDAQNLSIATFT